MESIQERVEAILDQHAAQISVGLFDDAGVALADLIGDVAQEMARDERDGVGRIGGQS